jgi:hypothetical protein
MDIPLVLRRGSPERLVYAIPLWYRLAMALIGGVLVGAILVANDKPSAFEWVALALVAFAALYEERWVLDGKERVIRHRFGLLFAARTVSLSFDRIEGFRLRAFVRGTAPGGPTEAADSARILSSADPTGDADALQDKKSLRKAYVTLLCDDKDGGGLVINTLPARRIGELKNVGASFGSFTGRGFEGH